jgi:YidC/Oxa1 family membrane protein insertase
VAIIVLTIIVRIVTSPLFHLQIRLSRRAMEQQRRLAPELAELKKKYARDPRGLQQAQMELYRERGINPLGGLSGCLPALLQYPILYALYFVFRGVAQHKTFGTTHFLFIPNLNTYPNAVPWVHGLPIPAPAYLVIPILAAATTFIQSRMMQVPPSPNPTEQERQQQQMSRTMSYMMPLFFLYITIITPAGLGLYWFVSNCFSIFQQYLVNGWGGLRLRPATATELTPAPATTVRQPVSGASAPARSPRPANRPPRRSAKRTRRARK